MGGLFSESAMYTNSVSTIKMLYITELIIIDRTAKSKYDDGIWMTMSVDDYSTDYSGEG